MKVLHGCFDNDVDSRSVRKRAPLFIFWPDVTFKIFFKQCIQQTTLKQAKNKKCIRVRVRVRFASLMLRHQ